jgi:hypothetical protein
VGAMAKTRLATTKTSRYTSMLLGKKNLTNSSKVPKTEKDQKRTIGKELLLTK